MGHWDKRLINQASDVPGTLFQVLFFFFIISCKILCKKGFNLFFLFFYKFTKIEINSFECPKSLRNYEKNNAWNIRRLVNELFVPSTQWASVLYWRLLDLIRILYIHPFFWQGPDQGLWPKEKGVIGSFEYDVLHPELS